MDVTKKGKLINRTDTLDFPQDGVLTTSGVLKLEKLEKYFNRTLFFEEEPEVFRVKGNTIMAHKL